MNPGDAKPWHEMVWAGFIWVVTWIGHACGWVFVNWTDVMTGLGATAGAFVGLHATYRIIRPKRRRNRRATDRE